MAAPLRVFRVCVLWIIFSRCLAWDNDELELFDLVEEVNANFYDVLGVGQDASSSDIRKAYRKLSLQLHPDKNKAEDAEEKFRQLVAVYEVLKDEEKRQRYNQVLVEGLPDWKTPVFYYRRARKMGFAELSAVLAIIVTIGQYLVGWAVYIERRLTLEDRIDTVKKKEKKKKNKVNDEAEELQEEIASLPRPRVLDLWPFRLPVFLFHCVRSVPVLIARVKEEIEERRRRKAEEEEESEEEGMETVTRKPKRRKLVVPEYTGEEYDPTRQVKTADTEDSSTEHDTHIQTPSHKGGEWSEEELVLLAKAVNKYPGGTVHRWEKIANMVGRSVEEVSAKSKTIKGTYAMNLSAAVQGDVLSSKGTTKKQVHISDNIITTAEDTQTSNGPSLSDSNTESDSTRRRHRPTKIPKTPERTLMISQSVNVTSDDKKEKSEQQKVHKDSKETAQKREKLDHGGKTQLTPPAPSSSTTIGGGGGGGKGGEGTGDGDTWTQNQQVIFEWALRHFPKGTDKRWDRIAEQIPGKTKEDCITRFKYLADLVKKKKEESQQS